jgi:hypothetical protein
MIECLDVDECLPEKENVLKMCICILYLRDLLFDILYLYF